MVDISRIRRSQRAGSTPAAAKNPSHGRDHVIETHARHVRNSGDAGPRTTVLAECQDG
jgi:hypothetical protein